MQYRSTNATLESGCKTVFVHHSIEWCTCVFLSAVVFTQLRYIYMQINVFIVNIIKVYIERNNVQLELIL